MDLHIGRSQTTPIDVRRPGLLDRLHLRPATPKYSLQDTLHTLILPANMEWRAPLFPAGPAAGGRGKGVAFATMMMVNAILGAGILSLPYACYKAGLLMSVPFLLLVTCLAYITAMWIVETQSRAQALAHLTVQAYRVTEPESWADDEPDLFPPLPPARPSATRELRAPGQRSASPATRGEILEETRASLESARRAGRSVAHFALPPMPEDFRIADDTRVFELNELCRMFLGRRCQRGYELALFLYVYATLWLYSSIVANTVISIVPVPGLTRFLECDAYGDVFPPECLSSYRLFLAALCALFLPICFVEIAALARVQVFLNVLGYACIGVMIVSVAAALFLVPAEGAHSPGRPPYIAPEPIFDLRGFGILFATTIFTQMGHWGVPSITQVVADKQRINVVLMASFSLTFTLYTIMGTLCVLYFGGTVLPTITLNWRHFTLYHGGVRPAWISALSTAVVALPVFTISCAIPMFVHTLANNMISAVSKETWKRVLPRCLNPTPPPDEDQVAFRTGDAVEDWPPYRLKVAARACTLVPPFALAFLERDASAIVSLCGLFGFVIMFFVPALLQWYSVRAFVALWPHIRGVSQTPFSGLLSHRAVVVLVLLFSTVGFAFNAHTVFEKLLHK